MIRLWPLTVVFIAAPALSQQSEHPALMLLDKNEENVLTSGGPVSLYATCGQCHDTDYITHNSYHVSAGLDEMAPPGHLSGERAWDISSGPFGRWDPLTYRLLTAKSEAELDLGTADWIRLFGSRHVGGGPAEISREGKPLEELQAGDDLDPETHVLNPNTGLPEKWDWQGSGSVEMNCFLCHLPNPDNSERIRELKAGRFRWAATATLARTGLVKRSESGWEWDREGFDEDGVCELPIRDPKSGNCGICHALVHYGQEPLDYKHDLDMRATETEGQVYSPQRISGSNMNLAGKDTLSCPWDIHAERLYQCTNCHYSVNNPAFSADKQVNKPGYPSFDSSRENTGDYLERPSHNFAKGSSASILLADSLDGSMRLCESCHDAEKTHTWHPNMKRHLRALACEACHIPRIHAPARSQVDWTVLTPEGQARIEYRGVKGSVDETSSLVTGWQPVLLAREKADRWLSLYPHNIISSWYWVAGDPERPVRLQELKLAFFLEGAYHPDIVSALDENGDRVLSRSELALDTPEKTEAVKKRLEAVGIHAPRIKGEMQPYSIHHNVVSFPWATRRCKDCHSRESRISQPLRLAAYVPGGVVPETIVRTNARMNGELRKTPDGGLEYRPASGDPQVYILGHDRSVWLDGIGLLAILGALAGVVVHGGLRLYIYRQRKKVK